ncbi:CDP-glycerol glycerophosphotransferase family protein [Streptomyces sp. NPDC091272]|uniref:bifunctional glycosyltransferase/CDP-glycerol:glycerophosphate glycerophosphotransferase n=1 Tax=Streptomyces sp. NPDC091272 TaxID=3365981 RepID=UPI0037F1E277
MPPELSIVVPFQDVQEYLDECLESIRRQSFSRFEVIMVDDGSSDGSTEIAESYCRRDSRFRLLRQEANGPGHARNTGIRAAYSDAEFLAFVDGDDVVPHYAYELLVRTLRQSGSDFVSGNVQMMNSTKTWQSPLHGAPMKRARRGTHITRQRELIYDRTVWNKVFRREFWDHHFLEFPEGVMYEDSWVNLVAHFRAAKVDVVNEHVYFWRRRDGASAPSITQRHTEVACLRDRISAVRSVSGFLAGHRARAYETYKRWYDEACLKSDLMIHLNVLPDADEEFQDLFMRRAKEFLDEADPSLVDELPAVQRLKWSLVREEKLAELLEVLAFERKGGALPVRRRARRYLDYPYLGDRSVGLGKRTYRVDKELALHASLGSAHWQDDRLQLNGTAYIKFLNVHKRRMSVKALALRNRKTGRRMVIRARTTYAPQATEASQQSRYCYDWSGFRVDFDPKRLQEKGKWVEGTWDVAMGAYSRGLFRYKSIGAGAAGTAAHPPVRYVDKNTRLVPLFVNGTLKLRVEIVRCRITRHQLVGEDLELRGVLLADEVPTAGTFQVRSLKGAGQYRADVRFTPGGDGWCTFRTRIPVARLVPEGRFDDGSGVPKAWTMGSNGWKTSLSIEGRRAPLYPVMAPGTEDGHYPLPARLRPEGGARECVVHRNGNGYVVLFERETLPIATALSWSETGALRLTCGYSAASTIPAAPLMGCELVVRSRAHGVERTFPVDWQGDTFVSELHPARVRTFAGDIPLTAGRWDFYLRVPGPGARQGQSQGPPHTDLMVKLDQGLLAGLPGQEEIDERRYEIQPQAYDRLTLLVHSAMPDSARGPYRQKLLRTRTYPAVRRQPLRETILFDAFKGTQYSDSPRALHEELVRRGTHLEQLWVVRDDQVDVPPTCRAVRLWSKEWYEALAASRYIVANNHLPDWFERREDQVVVQTWHGTPLKKIGHDIEAVHFADRRYLERLEQEVKQWSVLVSPNSFSTPILRRAFGFEGELLTTGYPRNDLLLGADSERRAAQVRRRIGLPEGKKVIMYAPTWRDDQFYAPGRYKFDFRIDLEEARAELAADHVLLVRRHPNVVDPVPEAGDGFVWDVSEYPDMAELALITDVMVTDYSSLMFDYAVTGRPILFFTYDLEHYRDTLRGFYFDFERSAPGPLLSTSAELIRAVRDIDQVSRVYRARYRWFQQQFCDYDDGGASGRLLDRIMRANDIGPAALPAQRDAGTELPHGTPDLRHDTPELPHGTDLRHDTPDRRHDGRHGRSAA